MIETIFVSLVVFGVFALVICHSTTAYTATTVLNSNEAEAKQFLNQSAEKQFNLFDKSAKDAFSNTSLISYDVKEENLKYAEVLKSLAEDSKKFDFKNFNDEQLKYAFEALVRVADDKIIGPEKYLEIYNAMEELAKLTNQKNTQEYGNNSTKELAVGYVYNTIFETSDDPEELQYYWSAIRKLTGSWAVDNLNKILQGIKDAAKFYELSPLEFWLRGFNMTDMEQFVTETQPLYLQLHAFLRNQLRKKYGESIIKPDGLIPDHLMEQSSFQILADRMSFVEEKFPSASLPLIDATIMEEFTGKELYEMAEGFYESLGFEKYPSSFWGDRIRMRTADAECSAREFHFTSNIYLEFCEEVDFDSFLEAYEYMGYIYYAKEMKGLPAYFFNTPHFLEHTIGNAMKLSASTYHNLKAVGIVHPNSNIPEKIEMHRLFKMAITHLLQIPVNFVYIKVMADLLTGNVEMAELNTHYWHLMEKYAGIGPAKGHKTDSLDLPNVFYEDMNDNFMSSGLTNGVLTFQIYKRLCELSGKYPSEPLYLCDISGSKDAGNALKKMMQLGVSKPFYEVLATMFPENPTVRTEGILEYFAPIIYLLTEKNKKANVKIGWKTSDSN